MSTKTSRRAPFIFTAIAGILFASVRPAVASWSSSETIGLTGSSVDTSDVRLRTNAAGDAVVSWREGTSVVRAAIRPAGGPFGASQTLDGATQTGSPIPHPALGPDGRAIVMWFANPGTRKLRYADRPADQTAFASAVDLFTPPQDLTSLDVVIDDGGATHVAYNGPGFAQYPRVWARTRGGSEGDAFGSEASITGNLSPGAPGQIALATAGDGTSVLTFYSPSADVAPGSQQQHILGTVRALDDLGWQLPGENDWMCCLSLGPQGVSSLAMDGAGKSYFVVHGVNDFADVPQPGPNAVRVGADGIVLGRQQLDPTWSNAGVGPTNGGSPQIAVDPSGNAWAAWAKQVGTEMKLFTAFRPAGEGTTFGKGKAIASDLSLDGFQGSFQLTATPGGAVVAWLGGCGQDGCDVESAVTGAASGTFWHQETAAAGARLGHGLQLAGLPADDALLVYRKGDGHLKARVFIPPPLRAVTAPLHRAIPGALANGIPVAVDVGVDGSDVRVKILDESDSLGLSRPFAARKTALDRARGQHVLTVKFTPEAAQQIAAQSVVHLTLRVTATPPGGAPNAYEQKLVLRQ